MIILGIRTDSDSAELWLLDNNGQIDSHNWQSGRQLSSQILKAIDDFLSQHSLESSKIEGLVVFKGPGSFTGLRIGITVANTMAYGLGVPIVGTGGEDWFQTGCKKLADGTNEKQVMPHYGAEANITKPRK